MIILAMDGCIFCKIVGKEAPSTIVRETESLLVINSIDPAAPVHRLIIPKTHSRDLRELSPDLWLRMREMAVSMMIEEKHVGVRIVLNVGDAAAIPHTHMHYLAPVDNKRHV